jgi:2-methylaconitate cis-trans-isomerase PrpF
VDGLSASLVDATNAIVFVRAKDIGLTGTESPQAMDGDRALVERLERIRVAAAQMMGIPGSAATPKVAVVAPPASFTGLDGNAYTGDQMDLVARVISMGNCHRAFALTAAMCLAVAARIEGTVVRECSTAPDDADVRLAHPSGILPLDARVVSQGGRPHADRVTVYRTARRLMEGFIRVP